MGRGRPQGRAAVSRLFHHVPRPRDAGSVREVSAGDLPGLRPRQLHLERRGRPVGVDDVQRVPVGPQLGESRCALRIRRAHLLAGEQGRGRLPFGRHRLHLEAHGDQLPEPAGGPRPHAGPARVPSHRRSRGGVQGGGDRRPRGSHALPGCGAPLRSRLRHGLSQRAHGSAVELLGHGRSGDGAGGLGRDAPQADERDMGDVRPLP